MKLITFSHEEGGAHRVAALDEDGQTLIDLQVVNETVSLAAPFASVLELLSRNQGLADAQALLASHRDVPQAAVRQADVHMLAPVPLPNSIRDCMAFERHLVQCTQQIVRKKAPPIYWLDQCSRRLLNVGLIRAPKAWHQRPVYYKGNRRSVVGTDADVTWPSYTDRFDFELEFGVFIGKQGTNIAVSEAQQYIAGYTLFNDFSARDIQLAEMSARLGPAKAKDFDSGNAIGPWLTTPDEIQENALELEVRVNDEVWTKTDSREMRFSFAEIISHISQHETLYPGDFIGSGTLPNGCGWELDRWLQPGDTVELVCSALGTLRNTISR